MRSLTHHLRNAALLGLVMSLGACRFFDSRDTSQRGERGTGMQVVYPHKATTQAFNATKIPAIHPPAGESPPGPLPWKNVQVLNDVSVAEFNRTMLAMAEWVAGPGNCQYCHNIANFASDTANNGKPLYTKVVARRMLQMTRQINGQWQQHVVNTGVTCYTCHRGKPLPNGLWFYSDENQYLRHYLDSTGARVVTHQVAPTPDNRSSVKQTEWTYALMISQSRSLGVNCTFCHNTRQFASWEQSPPQRVKAFYGIQMLRDVNRNYMTPLATVFPSVRLGAKGDAPKAQCLTCHNGVYKPLYAAQMTKHYPALWGRDNWNGEPFPGIHGPAKPDSTKKLAAAPAAATAPAAPAAMPAPVGSKPAAPAAGKPNGSSQH
jgi:photosynthetic reaction center cytochrome c subunit